MQTPAQRSEQIYFEDRVKNTRSREIQPRLLVALLFLPLGTHGSDRKNDNVNLRVCFTTRFSVKSALNYSSADKTNSAGLQRWPMRQMLKLCPFSRLSRDSKDIMYCSPRNNYVYQISGVM